MDNTNEQNKESSKQNADSSNNSPLGAGTNSPQNGGMHYGASPILFDLARQLRTRMTEAEQILWNMIKTNNWGLKFRRQHPLSFYIADFYCHSVKLVIELDGGYHENKEVKIYDAHRENDICRLGITVIRFKNEEVIYNINTVLNKIEDTVNQIKESSKENTDSSNNSPLGVGADSPQVSPLGVGVDSPQASPLAAAAKSSNNSASKLFVIKIGGNVIDNEANLSKFLDDFSKIPAILSNSSNNSPLGAGADSPQASSSGAGGKMLLIHGGGKIATKIGDKLGIQSNYVNGRRITDAETIDLVTMVYGGLVNKKVVAQLQAKKCNAIGITGADANIIPAKKRPVTKEGIDFGFVGDVKSEDIGVQQLELLLEAGLTPIVAPLTHDGNGQMLNTNADTVASSLAVALGKKYDVRLIYCFEKKGVLENVDDENSVITLITKDIYKQLMDANKLFDGIIPKIDNAFNAIDNGVKEVLIGDANDLLRNVTDDTIGTLIR